MKPFIALFVALGLGACRHSGLRSPQGLDAASEPAGRTLRKLTGDNIMIEADGSARAAGSTYKYEPVRDGHPSAPQRANVHGVGGDRSILFQVPSDMSGHKERIEYKIAKASDPDGLHFDNARYSKFSFRLAAPTAPFLSSAIIYQCWQGFPFGPPVSLKIVESGPPYKLKLAVRNMATGPDSATPDMEIWSSSIIQPETWYTITIYIEPRYHTHGRLSLWINGANQVNWSGRIGYDPNQVPGVYNGLDIKNGIYQPGSNNGHTFFFDQILLEAAP